MNQLFDSSGKRVHTLSSAESVGRTELHICRDIRSYLSAIDYCNSRIKSARDHISNLLEELERTTERIAAKNKILWSKESLTSTEEDLQDPMAVLDQHGTNLLKVSEILAGVKDCLKDASDLVKSTQERGTSPDLHCYETMSPSKKLLPGTTYVCGGTTVHLEPESHEEPLKNCPELTEKIAELSGGMDTSVRRKLF